MNLIIWLFLWFSTWILYNLLFKKWLKANKNLTLYRATYFIIPTLISISTFRGFITPKLIYLFLGFLLTSFLGLLIHQYKFLNRNIETRISFLYSLPFNLMFQQVMFVSAIYIVQDINIYVGLLGVIAHLPIILLKWVKLKYLYLLLIFVGCTSFYSIVRNINYGVVISFLVHYSAYLGFLIYLKNDEYL